MLKLIDQGWMPYGHAPFNEDQDKIARLLGTAIYETTVHEGICYVRKKEAP